MPVVDVEVGSLTSLAMQCIALIVGDDGIDQQGIVALHAEVERSNADGDGHIHVVGVDVGRRGIIRCIADTLGAGGKKEEGRCKKEEGRCFHSFDYLRHKDRDILLNCKKTMILF